MLDKNEILDQINKFIIPDSLCFEDNAKLDPYFMSCLTLPKYMPTSFFTQPTCFTHIIINNLPMTQVHLHGNNILAHLLGKGLNFIGYI